MLDIKEYLTIKNFLWASLSVFVLGGLYLTYVYFSTDLPPIDTVADINIPESTKLYDRTGEVVLYEIYKDEKRTVIPSEDIPEAMREATLSM